jgi:predicted membrane protein
MNDYKDFKEDMRNRWEERMERNPNSHVWTGLFLLVIGGLALVKSFGVPLPVWLFTWQMLLIAIGLFIGLKKGFSDGGWFVPIIIGGAFLLNDYFIDGNIRRHLWPLILICIGVLFIFRPKRRRRWRDWSEKKNAGIEAETITPLSETEYSKDDFVNSTCIFSGAKRVVLSKNFKGGDLVNVFGGCEIDLMQADMTSPAVVDVTAIFGGATLVVPSNWAIKSEAVTIFGGISDKRRFTGVSAEPTKTLVLKGTMIFGGLEIKSY